MATFTLNGDSVTVEAEPNAPLLWVVREHLGLTGTKFGCGIGQCGACTVHLDGASTYACLTPVTAVEGRQVTTIEGPVRRRELTRSSRPGLRKRYLSAATASPDRSCAPRIFWPTTRNRAVDEIVAHMSTNICRCGTYTRIVRAIERAAREAENEA